jgi:hypothetical protein
MTLGRRLSSERQQKKNNTKNNTEKIIRSPYRKNKEIKNKEIKKNVYIVSLSPVNHEN